jgi:hypothetical protein
MIIKDIQRGGYMEVKHLINNSIDTVNVMIHTCAKRVDYVNKFLVPELKRQGIENIIVYNDENMEGNLKSFLKSLEAIPNDKKWTVHLQDDVWPGSNFKKLCEIKFKEHPEVDVICMYCSQYDNKNSIYLQSHRRSWFSLPCIKIKNCLINDFVKWANLKDTRIRYKDIFDSGKNDDVLFKKYLNETGKLVINYACSSVQNVDYLISGSTINNRSFTIQNPYFNDDEAIKRLKNLISEEENK